MCDAVCWCLKSKNTSAQASVNAIINSALLVHTFQENRIAELQLPAVSTTLIILLFAVLFWSMHSRRVYLVDFSCYKPDDELKASVDKFLKVTENRGLFQEDSFHFQKRIANRACIGDETYLPRGVTSSPPNLSFDQARSEAESVMFGALLFLTKLIWSKLVMLESLSWTAAYSIQSHLFLPR